MKFYSYIEAIEHQFLLHLLVEVIRSCFYSTIVKSFFNNSNLFRLSWTRNIFQIFKKFYNLLSGVLAFASISNGSEFCVHNITLLSILQLAEFTLYFTTSTHFMFSSNPFERTKVNQDMSLIQMKHLDLLSS